MLWNKTVFVLAVLSWLIPTALVAQTLVSPYQVSGKPIYNVVSEGAKADGTTDDATSINATITKAASAASGAIVLFPPGTYVIKSPLQFGGAATGASVRGLEFIGIGNPVIRYGGSLATSAAMIQANEGDFVFCAIRNIRLEALRQTNCFSALGSVGVTETNKFWTFEDVDFVEGHPYGVMVGNRENEGNYYRDVDWNLSRFEHCTFNACTVAVYLKATNVYQTVFTKCGFQWDSLYQKGYMAGYIVQEEGWQTLIEDCFFAPSTNANFASYTCIYANYGDVPTVRNCLFEDPRMFKTGGVINFSSGGIFGCVSNDSESLYNSVCVNYQTNSFPLTIRDTVFNYTGIAAEHTAKRYIYASGPLILDNVDLGRFGEIKVDNWRESRIEGMRPGSELLIKQNWNMHGYALSTGTCGVGSMAIGFIEFVGSNIASASANYRRYPGNSENATYSMRVYAAILAEATSGEINNGMGIRYVVASGTRFSAGVTAFFGGVVDPATTPVRLAIDPASKWSGPSIATCTIWQDFSTGRFSVAASAYPASYLEQEDNEFTVYFYGLTDTDNVTAPTAFNMYIDRVCIMPKYVSYYYRSPAIKAVLERGGQFMDQ